MYAFCHDAPRDELGKRLAIQAARNLGASRKWDPIEQARWLVQLSMAPKGTLNKKLASALLSGIALRTDGPPVLADMIDAMLELPADHPAMRWLVELLIPSGWRGRNLARALGDVSRDRVPLELLDAWSALEAASERE